MSISGIWLELNVENDMGEISYRVSADIGGTFTDLVVEPSEGPMIVGKVSTTPDDPARAVVEGLVDLVPDLSRMNFFVHGTTVGLNAFLERCGERVLLIMNKGAGDSYTIARGNRHTLYELRYSKPKQLVPRRDVHEVRGRLSWNGGELEPLNRSDFEPIVAKIKAEGINAIAVCLLHAYAYPQHELEAAQILTAALPGVSISLSHSVAREWREYERASSAVMNAYIAPVVARYLGKLREQLFEMGMTAQVHIMQSSGGITTAQMARKKPVFTLLSGSVGGTIAGTALAETSGRQNLLCIDMGGTSFDLSLVINGKANTTLETELEGLPLLMSAVDIKTIGTGGGSIAWIENGAMRVGPHSAGSLPGPACYGRGGTDPTVTDANLFLGRLGAKSLLGGDMSLDTEAARTAMKKLSPAVNLTPVEFAEGILAISNAAMANAMRTITVSQGLDPREFTLVAFGGAGPMAAAFLAEELDINEVLIPRFPGTFSAWGMLQTDLRHDLTVSFYHPVAAAEVDNISSSFAILESEGKDLVRAEGVAEPDISFQRSADMRYIGQEYTINVPITEQIVIAAVAGNFHSAHQRRYGHSSPSAPIEFVNLRLAAIGAMSRPDGGGESTEIESGDEKIGQRKAIFGGETYQTEVIARDRLPADFEISGPVIIEEQSATTIVPPGWKVVLDGSRNVLLTRENRNE